MGYEELESRVRKQYEKALDALVLGDRMFARTVLGEVLKREPGCFDARRLLRQAQVAGIKESFIQRLLKGVNQLLFIGCKGHRFAQKKPERAIHACEVFLEKWGPDRVVLRLMGKVALELNWSRTAITAFEAWLEMEDSSIEARFLLGLSLEQCGDDVEAIRVVERLVEIAPQHIQAQALLKRVSVRASLKNGKWMSRVSECH